MPSGLEGPSLSLLFKLFYLQLPHFRDREFLQSINESLSVDALTVQRSRSGRPATASLQDEDAYITVDRSELGDSIPVMDIVQRHHKVSFYLGDITDKQDMLDILERLGITYIVQNALLRRGAKDPSIYFRAYVEGTRAVIEAAIAAGVRKLVYTSFAGVVIDSADIVNVDERVPYLEKLFDMYNLLPYRSTTSSEPRLAPEGATAKLDKSLHRAPPPIRATTEYHCMMQTLSSYVAPTPDTGSILSTHNTPFDPHEPTGFVVHSRADEQASFVTGGEQIYILEATELFNECERWLSSLKIQDTYTRLRKVIGVRVVVSRVVVRRWSFEATEESRWRRGIGDSRAELNSLGFHFDLRTEDGHLQRIAIVIQETTTNCEQRTCGGTAEEFGDLRSPNGVSGDGGAVVLTLVLDDFVRDNLECGTSGMNYYSKLRRVTSGVFPHLVPDRYQELLRVARQWRLLKLLKWNGFLRCEQAPKKGELGLFCAACPQPGINVDLAEDLDHWKYTRMLVMDGNFKAEHMHDRHPADQVWLMDGHGFMVTDPDYRTYLKATPHITEKSACNNHKAINQANAQWGRLHSTGIGATACTWHSSWQFRQLNMDYSLANALQYNMTGINHVLCFYDINCSYMKNLRTWVRNSAFIDIPDSMQIMPGIGMWHVHGHKQECYARYAPLFMQGAGWVDGEIIETLWSLLNIASTSAQGMSSPHRQELLDFQISDCNFMKMIRMVHTVELEFLNNITSSGAQCGMGSWLARGLRLEEAAITLRIDYRNVGVHVPELKRLQDAGGDWNPINAEGSEQQDGQCMSDGYLSDAEDPNDGSDETLMADTTDLGGIATLLLPSNVGMAAFHSCNSGRLRDMELRLRIGQANDVLNGLQLALVDKAVVFRNVVRHAKSYSMKTRAWDAIHTINRAVRKQATIYKQCRKAMVALGASAETLTHYQQLETSDLTVSTAAITQNAHAHRVSHLPWFWSIDVPMDTKSITWMPEFYRTHWLRAKAVRDRWSEEEQLLMAEFQWTINYFNY
ncbi:hypothetical protein BKA82DRAFT_4450509 [Pisolithus tinctorius]|nr:hypothetical protein BKA82DRAFT_4450509 [Pisolithus tinctorius]